MIKMRAIIFDFKLRYKDYSRAYLFLLVTSWRFWLSIFFVFIALNMFLSLFYRYSLLISTLGITIWLFLLLGYRYYRSFRILVNDKRLLGKITVNVDEDYIYRKGSAFEDRISIDQLNKVIETKKWLFLWDQKLFLIIFPKKAISANDLELFKKILENGIKSSRLKLMS